MIAIKRLSILSILLMLLSCVTVNIYFPAAVAERVADQIIEDVWQTTPASKKSKKEKSDSEKSPTTWIEKSLRSTLANIVEFIVTPAYAQESPDFNASSPEVERIKKSMAARFSQLEAHFNSGAIGLTADGLISLRDINAVPLAQRGQINNLIQQENQDRTSLYAAIAAANNRPDWQKDIQQTFAKRWIAQARPGWWYQSASGWTQK